MDVSSLKLHGWTRRGAEGRARETRLCLRAGKGALKAKSSADGMSSMSEIQIKVFKYTRLSTRGSVARRHLGRYPPFYQRQP